MQSYVSGRRWQLANVPSRSQLLQLEMATGNGFPSSGE